MYPWSSGMKDISSLLPIVMSPQKTLMPRLPVCRVANMNLPSGEMDVEAPSGEIQLSSDYDFTVLGSSVLWSTDTGVAHPDIVTAATTTTTATMMISRRRGVCRVNVR